MGLSPNSSLARARSTRTSSSWRCSVESVMPRTLPISSYAHNSPGAVLSEVSLESPARSVYEVAVGAGNRVNSGIDRRR
jgi:hypothetical protein